MRRFLTGIALFVIATSIFAPRATRAVSSSIVISEFRARGPNGGSDEFVEIFNLSATSVNIGGWKLNGSNASGTTGTRATIPAGMTLGAGCHYLFTNSSTSGGPYSGSVLGDQTYATGITDDGGIAILDGSNTIIDQVGLSTGSAYKEGTNLSSLGSSNLDRSYERKAGGAAGSNTDTDNNSTDFQLIAPSLPQNRNSTCISGGSTSPTGSGVASPTTVAAGDNVTLLVTVTPGSSPTSTGVTVDADLTAIGGSATQPFYDDGTHGDSGSDGAFTFATTVTVSTTAGAKSLPFTVRDAQGRSSAGSIALAVTAAPTVLTIHEIQGPTSTSPFVGQPVRTEGIVTARRFNNGFFIQVPDAEVDADPNTSEGVFVFTSTAPPAGAAVGNRVSVTGTVAEFLADAGSLTATEITSPSVVVLSTGNPLPSAVVLTAADTSPLGPLDQLEKYEGMRVHVGTLHVVAPTQGSFSNPSFPESGAVTQSNGVYYGVLPGVQRPFREPGLELPAPLPPGSPCCVTRFDGNPERIRVDSNGNAAFSANQTTEVNTGATVTDITGVLDYSTHAYTILPDFGAQGTVTGTHGYSAVAAAGPHRFTVASANLERFFDTTDTAGIGDVALTAAGYAKRRAKVALQICDVMRAPDIIGVEEVENLAVLQDIAAAANGSPSCGGANYQAYLEEGNDIGGIDDGLLVNANRVQVNAVHQENKAETYDEPGGATALLNDRPPLVLEATIIAPGNQSQDVIVVANHLRSLNGIDDDAPGGDGPRVRAKRLAQAESLGRLIEDLQTPNGAPVIAVGDFNAFEFSDGYVDVIGTIKGTPVPADQVVLASTQVPNTSAPLVDLIESDVTANRYSYSFDGNAQSLDHLLATQAAAAIFDHVEWGHSNADFPESLRGDATRPERLSDHDPVVAYFVLAANTTTTVAASPNPADYAGDVTFTAHVTSDATVNGGFVHFTDGAGFSQSVAVVNGEASVTTAAAPFGLGVHSITAEYSDGTTFAASSGSASFAIADLTPPPPPTLTVTPNTLLVPNHKMAAITVSASSIDAVSGPAACSIESITSNEPDNGLGDGDTAHDIGPIAGLNASVRAERSGLGAGRVYTIVVGCSDAAGNTSSSSIGVSVPRGR